MNDNNSISSTIQRTLSILELFLEKKSGLTAQEIITKTGISRSTAFNMLKVLKDLKYLEQSQNRGVYSVGQRFSAWSGVSTPTYQSLIIAFQQEIKSQSFQETVALAAVSPQGVILIDQVESQQSIRAVYTLAEPVEKTSAAYKLLISNVRPEVYQLGYILVQQADSLELALPICADGVTPTAAILLKAPAFRMDKRTLLEDTLDSLRAVAARLSYRLGAVTYAPFQTQSLLTLQPKETLSEQQINQFLQGPWTARLACIRPDGNPHVIPVWQEWNGKNFHILAWQGSQWADFVLKNPQISLAIDEPWSPLRRVVCNGKALPVTDSDPGEREELISRLAQRYLGKETPILFQHQIENIFTIRAENLRGWKGLPTSG